MNYVDTTFTIADALQSVERARSEFDWIELVGCLHFMYQLLCESFQISQTAVRSFLVVVLFPLLSQHPRLCHATKQLHRQQLISKATVKALRITILPGRSRLDVQRFHPQRSQPRPNLPRDEFRAIVAANVLGHSPLDQQVTQHLQHLLGSKAPPQLQGQTLPRVLVDDRQPLQSTPTLRAVVDEVPGPHMILVRGQKRESVDCARLRGSGHSGRVSVFAIRFLALQREPQWGDSIILLRSHPFRLSRRAQAPRNPEEEWPRPESKVGTDLRALS